MKKLFAALSALLFAISALSQDVGKLYSRGMYSEVLRLLEGKQDQESKAYRTMSALSMKLPGSIELAKEFIKADGESIHTPQVRYLMALNLFDEELYAEALEQFELLRADRLYNSQLSECNFKKGFSAYSVGDWGLAQNYLARAKSLPYSDYSAPSYYTMGYMKYARKNFKEAQEWFELAQDDPRFSSPASYYILECHFNQKDYRYVVKNGDALYKNASEERRSRMARIMSESHLVLGNTEKARSYYEQNLKGGGTMDRSDYFYAGEVLYASEEWQGAVENFEKMGNRSDSLGQIASYQVAHSYLQLKNKVQAMLAFKDASALDFNPEIKEDAYYNFAKLAFDLGKDTGPFQSYLDKYGTKNKGNAIYSYMAMAALQNHDYEAAVAAYDHLDELDARMKSNYMKAYFLRARQLMESGAWRSAVPHLKAAAYYSPKTDGFNQLARYYQAEALFRDGKWDESRSLLTDLYNNSALRNRQEGKLIPYQTAYTYFKEADYEKARKWFQTYLDGDSSAMGADAATRIADCYFFSGDYGSAVNAYERQMTDYPDPDNLYPRLRAGVACGLLNDNKRKVHFLEDATLASPKAPYYGEALYELGRAYIGLKDEDSAIRTFSTLQTNTSDPALKSRALLELGMIARNAGRGNEALDYYKKVVQAGGEYSEDALLAIESIYRTREDPEAYLAYVNSLGDKAGRSEEQKEDVYFSSAEQIFMAGDYAKAQGTLQSYLEKYPKSANTPKAYFYLAECYRQGAAPEKAADYYEMALDEGLDGALGESALLQYAKVNYSLGNYGKSYSSWLKLQESARLEENKAEARIGLMRSAFKAREWEDAIKDAGVVLDSKDASAALKREARSIRANSYLSSSQRDLAMADFKLLSKEPSTTEGAEACYILIQDQYDRGVYDGLQDKVYDFSSKAKGQNYFLAKAFIVLGDSFAEQGNWAQARATFESIRDGYTPSGPEDDVLDQVDLRLRKLQD